MARTRSSPAGPAPRLVELVPAERPEARKPIPSATRSVPLGGHDIHALHRKNRAAGMVETTDERVLHQLRKAGRVWRVFAFGAGIRELVEAKDADEAKRVFLEYAAKEGHEVPKHALRVRRLAE